MGPFKRKRLEDLNPVPKPKPPVKPKPKPPPPVIPPVVIPPVEPSRPLIEVVSVFENWEQHCRYYVNGQLIVTGTEAPYEFPWQSLKTQNREPSIGYYNEPDVTQHYLESMQQGKFGVACYQIGWSHQHAVKYPYNPPLKIDPLLYDWGPKNHPQDSPTQFFLSNWDAPAGTESAHFHALRDERGWTDGDMELSHFEYGKAVGQLMLHPRYFHNKGRPVLMRGWAHTLSFYADQHGFNLSPARIVQIWREGVRSVAGVDPYIVATSMEESYRPLLKGWGFDGLTEYLLHGKGWDDAMATYRRFWNQYIPFCRNLGIDYWIAASAGYDDSAWPGIGLSAQGWVYNPTAAQYEAHCREARKVALENYDVTNGVVIHYALSEHGEGGILLPMKPGMLHDGDEILRAHAAACT